MQSVFMMPAPNFYCIRFKGDILAIYDAICFSFALPAQEILILVYSFSFQKWQ